MQECRGVVGAPAAPLTVLWDLLEPKNLWLQSLNAKGKNGRVRVQRWIFTGVGEKNRGKSGAGGLGGIGGSAETAQQGREKRKGTFLGRSPNPYKNDLQKVQSRRVCLAGGGKSVRPEMHVRGVRGSRGHLSRVKRRYEVVWGAPDT